MKNMLRFLIITILCGFILMMLFYFNSESSERNILNDSENKESDVLYYRGDRPDNTLEYLKKNDFNGFKKFHGYNDSILIEELYQIDLRDTIDIHKTWYGENDIDSFMLYRSTSIEYRQSHVSLKLKAFYWILVIQNSLELDTNEVCTFLDDSKSIIYDYDMTQESKDKFSASSNSLANIGFTKFQYRKVNHKEVNQLENSFSKWYKLFRENGLNYLSKKSISPLQKNEYRIVPYVDLLD